MNTKWASAALVTVLAVGCGGGFDRDGVVEELIEASGLPRDKAECKVDRWAEEFGQGVFASQKEPTSEEQATIREIDSECGLIIDVFNSSNERLTTGLDDE